MGTITENPIFENDIYLIQPTDPILGGEDGTVNIQPKQLTNRTAYLKSVLDAQHVSGSDHVVTNSMVIANAAINEGKLLLDYPTSVLRSKALATVALATELENNVNQATGQQGSTLSTWGKAVELTWNYSSFGYEFDMFSSSLVMRDIQSRPIISAVAGDDTIECTTTAGLQVDDYYVLSTNSGSTNEIIRVRTILNESRFQTYAPVNTTRTSGKLGRTSWDILQGSAKGLSNSIYLTRNIGVLEAHSEGKLIIRRDFSPAYFFVYWRVNGSTTWTRCNFLSSSPVNANFKDDTFHIPGDTEGQLRIDVKGLTGSNKVTIDHLFVSPIKVEVSYDEVRRPVNVSPANGASNVSTGQMLTGTPFQSLYGDTQASSQFQISKNEFFSTTVLNKTENGAVIQSVIDNGSIDTDEDYFWRCRYKDSKNIWSAWSRPTKFTTRADFSSVDTPIILTPTAGSTLDIRTSAQIAASSFLLTVGTGTHYSSDWQISDSTTFTTVVFSSTDDTVNKTSIDIDSTSGLLENTHYYVRTRYRANLASNVKIYSSWSAPIKFRATSKFNSPTVGAVLVTSGANGGEWTNVSSLGVSEITGNEYFNTHPIFSNIVDIDIDGQSMVKIPKFYYKRGVFTSGEFVGKPYWMISDQAETGFTVHPAFVHNGAEVPQFYIGKYQGYIANGKLSSIIGVSPTVSNTLAQFKIFAAARNEGGAVTGFMVWSYYQLAAIQLLYLIEKLSMDSQTVTGLGRTATTNTSRAAVNSSNVAQASYRNIVGLWGNINCFVDGVKTVNGVVNLWNINGYQTWVNTAQTTPSADSFMFPNTFKSASGSGYDFGSVFIPSSGPLINSDATCPDLYYFESTGEKIATVGGSWNSYTNAGLWALRCDVTATDSNTTIGTRLAKI